MLETVKRWFRKPVNPAGWTAISSTKWHYVPPHKRTPVEIYQQNHPDRSILAVKGSCILGIEGLYEHCAIARKSGFPQLIKGQYPPYVENLIVVGSGLSALDHLDEIRSLSATNPVMAIKGAHDWLMDNGITPTYAVAADPQESRHDCFRRLNDETIYLPASQMHPKTWGYLKGRKVIIWHAQINKDQNNLPEWRGFPLIPGGGTTGLRALSLAWVLGFRNIETYGMDSCIDPDGVYKLDGSVKIERDVIRTIWVGDKQFLSTDLLVSQTQGLMGTLQCLPGIKLTAHGEGLFQEVLRQGKLAGWPV